MGRIKNSLGKTVHVDTWNLVFLTCYESGTGFNDESIKIRNFLLNLPKILYPFKRENCVLKLSYLF